MAQLLDATKTQKHLIKPRNSEKFERNQSTLPEQTAINTSATNKTPFQILLQQPLDQAWVSANPVIVQGIATNGTHIQIDSEQTTVQGTAFSIPVTLKTGRNEIKLIAKLNNNTQERQRIVYFFPEDKISQVKKRLVFLRNHLKEIEAVQDELSETLKALEGQLQLIQDQKMSAELNAEKSRITQIRKELFQEVEKAKQDIENCLNGK